jgi:hypothetical protein
MKFEPGNLLYNKRTKGVWLVVEALPINQRGSYARQTVFRLQMNAACIQPGLDKVNHAGSTDTWWMQQEDGSDQDNMWTVINEV